MKYDVDRIYKYINMCSILGYSSEYKMIKYIYRKLGLKGVSSSKRDLTLLSPYQKKRACDIVLDFLDNHLPQIK